MQISLELGKVYKHLQKHYNEIQVQFYNKITIQYFKINNVKPQKDIFYLDHGNVISQ